MNSPDVTNQNCNGPSAANEPAGSDRDGSSTSSAGEAPSRPASGGTVQPRSKQNLERAMEYLVELEADDTGDTPEDKKKKSVLRMALKDSKDSLQVLDGKVQRRNKQIDGLKFEIYQLVALFSVFSGVVFTAATQPNRLEPQHIWSPLALSTFAYAVIVLVTYKNFRSIESLEEINSGDKTASKSARHLITELRTYGYKRFTFEINAPEPRGPAAQKPPHTALWVTLSLLTGFSILLWGSILHILLTKSPSV